MNSEFLWFLQVFFVSSSFSFYHRSIFGVLVGNRTKQKREKNNFAKVDKNNSNEEELKNFLMK